MYDVSPQARDVVQVEVARDGANPELPVAGYSLTDLAPEFAMFTIGCFHTHGGLTTDPVREFVLTHADPACDAAFHDFASPLFKGIARRPEDEAYDRRLWFVAHRWWPGLLRFLSGVAAVDRKRRRYFRATVEICTVVDPLAQARGPGPGVPVVPVTCFGISGTHRHVGFRPCTDTPPSPARVVGRPLDPRMREVADAILSGRSGSLDVLKQ